MDFKGLNFDQMAQETFELSNTLRNPNSVDFEGYKKFIQSNDSDFLDFRTDKSDLSKKIYPAKPGLIFRIECGMSTFCIRGVPAEDIQYVHEMVEIGDKEILNKLRLGKSDERAEVLFFETESVELSEVIHDQIINRRFPYCEEVLCNLSDPGLSWWMDNRPSGFRIFFKSYGIDRASELKRLGPIGDNKIACLRLAKSINILESLFCINDFSCSESCFSISTNDISSKLFRTFRNIFLKGDNEFSFDNFSRASGGRTLYYYLKEIAVLRKFWSEVEAILKHKTDHFDH